MAPSLSESLALAGASRFAEAGEQATALSSFWRDFVRRPSASRTPGRQFIEGPLDAHPVWVTRDDDPEHALWFTPNVFLGGLDDDNVVEVPCLHVALPAAAPGTSGAASDDQADAALAHAAALRLPLPHYQLASQGRLYLIWRIEPLRRPPKKAPESHHQAWRQCLLAWRMAQVKLALAFAPLGSEAPTGPEGGPDAVFTARLPLPHPPTPARYLDSDAVLLAAAPERPSLRIRDVSAPLNLAFDTPAWAKVRPHASRIPLFLLGKDAWTSSPRFLAAMGPKREGERHPAALTIACVLRWAGREKEEVLDTLRRWHAQNLDQRHFPQERAQSDELEDLVEWAFRKLVPGGPTRPEPEVRGRYTAKERALQAVLGFLESQEAAALGWVGTQEDLARGATLWAADAQSGAVVTRDSLQKLLPSLKARGLSACVERIGRTWTTTWRVCKGATAPTTVPEAPRPRGAGESPPPLADPTRAHSLDSQRQMQMSIARPRLAPVVSPGEVGLAPLPVAKRILEGPRVSPPVGSVAVRASDDDSVVSRVRALCRLGFSVILLKPGTKEPVRESWAPAQSRPASVEMLERALLRQPDANLAIVCGAVSGVVAVDLDSEEALLWAQAHLPSTPIRCRTARGEHWFYRHPGGGPVKNRARLRGCAVDVKGDGGYVVAPGSLHPSGVRYQGLGDWDEASLAELPAFEPAWLLSEEEMQESGALPGEDEAAYARRWLRNLREAARTGNWRALRRNRQPSAPASGVGKPRSGPGHSEPE